jgi:hypothetical protein
MRSEKKRILGQLNAATKPTGDGTLDALTGLGATAQAMGELRTYFRKLQRVAPDEIHTEVKIVSEAVDQQLKAAGDAAANPLGAFGSALVTSLTTSGQLQTVDTYARKHCGEGI